MVSVFYLDTLSVYSPLGQFLCDIGSLLLASVLRAASFSPAPPLQMSLSLLPMLHPSLLSVPLTAASHVLKTPTRQVVRKGREACHQCGSHTPGQYVEPVRIQLRTIL